ncbi:MAG: CDP-alcohol phosphatidyltransferase family protein [Alphaproteobacteria bacterium]
MAQQQVFPVIRRISHAVSPVLARAGFTPNQVTFLGLVAGLASAGCFSVGTHFWGITGALFWAICSLMDYCDGEVARLTGKSSRFGAVLDDVVDWIVHSAFFLGLGYGAFSVSGSSIWLWLGAAAAVGTTINTFAQWCREWLRASRGEEQPRIPGEAALPENFQERIIYVFRGLFRADFWLLVLVLEAFHITWLMLPVFAVGVQVYWLTGLMKNADKFVP